MVQRCIGGWGTCDGASPGYFPFANSSRLGVFASGPVNLACSLKAVCLVRLSGWLSPGFIEDHLRCPALPNLGRFGSYASSFCFGDHCCQPSPLDMITDLTAMFFFWCRPRSPRMERGCSERSEDELYLLLSVSPLFAAYEKGWVLRRRFGVVPIRRCHVINLVFLLRVICCDRV